MSEFEKWYARHRIPKGAIYKFNDVARDAWNQQQQKINLMQKMIDELKGTVKYSEKWLDTMIDADYIECRNDEDCDHCCLLSELLRTKQKIKQLEKELKDKDE